MRSPTVWQAAGNRRCSASHVAGRRRRSNEPACPAPRPTSRTDQPTHDDRNAYCWTAADGSGERRLPDLHVVQQGGGAQCPLPPADMRTPAIDDRHHPCRHIAQAKAVQYTQTRSARAMNHTGMSNRPLLLGGILLMRQVFSDLVCNGARSLSSTRCRSFMFNYRWGLI